MFSNTMAVANVAINSFIQIDLNIITSQQIPLSDTRIFKAGKTSRLAPMNSSISQTNDSKTTMQERLRLTLH
ncbi:MAG: hypothetical protein JNK27_12920 [Chitinophagaceae bacterium]|nr:hypothetical protein [Chitinophagaceae bacterium]